MPMLCRAGAPVECCAPTASAPTESRGCPDECPDQRSTHEPDKRPNGAGSPEQRDCFSCAVCHVVSPHMKTAADEELASTPAATVATPLFFADLDESPSPLLPDLFDGRPHAHLPYPSSDRPLLI